MTRLKRWARRLALWLNHWAAPDPIDLVCHLILHTASLELPKGEWIELAPIKGCCGPFRLSGNSLPVFEYKMFEKTIMEFIKVRVEIGKPGRIQFICTIESDTAPERNGEPVETTPRYREPFERLCFFLFQYFPYYRDEKKSQALRQRIL